MVYKLAEECFKTYDGATKYVDYGYLKSIGYRPFDFRGFSSRYIAARISFSQLEADGSYSANPDIGLRMVSDISQGTYAGTPEFLYFLLAPGETVEVRYRFLLSENWAAYELFDNTYQYSVMALETGLGGQKDSEGRFVVEELTAEAIENKQGAFRSAFGKEDEALVSSVFGLGWI
jgi:hypothetical protein